MSTDTLNTQLVQMNSLKTKRGHILSPASMRELSLANNSGIRAWAAQHGLGTRPATFPEVSGTAPKSRKNSCLRKKRRN